MINLGMNENQLGCSKKAIAAINEAIGNINTYPEFFSESLKNTIANKYCVQEQQVLITNGSSGMIELLGAVYIQANDEVIFCIPTFMIYKNMTEDNGGKVVMLPLTSELEYDLDAIKKAITKKTKMIVICNPNNPTGTYIGENKLVEFLKEVPSNIMVVVDEAYLDFASSYDCKSMVPYINEFSNLIILKTFSKMYALAGMRIGYAFASSTIIDELNKRLYVFTVNKLGVLAAIASLEDDEFFENSYNLNLEGKKYLTEEFKKLNGKVIPSETNFIYVKFKKSPAIVAKDVLDNGIIIRGDGDYNRVSIGTMEQNKKLVEILNQIL